MRQESLPERSGFCVERFLVIPRAELASRALISAVLRRRQLCNAALFPSTPTLRNTAHAGAIDDVLRLG